MRNIYVLLVVAVMLCWFPGFAQTSATATVALSARVQPDNGKALRLYPNPADKYVNIYVEWAVPQAFVISVYDYQFDSWIDEIPVDVRKSFQYSLDVSRLPAGRYKIQLKSGDKVSYEDLTVKH